MAKYAVTMEGDAGNPLTIGDVSVTATLPRRISVYDFIIGSDATPADTGFEWVVQRSSASGTGTAVVPARLDIADAEMVGDAQENHSIEPTYTATEEVFDIALNLRATFRWVAAPDGEMIIPATDNAGLGWACDHASATGNQKLSIHMSE